MKAGLIAAAALVVAGCGDAGSQPTDTQARIQDEIASTPVTPQGWSYRENKDPMTDGTTHFACVTSEQTVNLQSPYEPVTADLCIRQSPQYGTDVMVSLNGDGQMLCRSYESCTVKVRFGDGAQQSFSAIGPSDNSSNMLFIENAKRFIQGVKAAPLTRIQATFYEAGDQVMEFKTANLEWPRPTSPD